eukprot:10567516-Lingulodinium_polyedra.AAC.1
MVFYEPPPADRMQYNIRLCAAKDAPSIAGPTHYLYNVSDGTNTWLWCRICGKPDDGQLGHISSSKHLGCLFYMEGAEKALREGI